MCVCVCLCLVHRLYIVRCARAKRHRNTSQMAVAMGGMVMFWHINEMREIFIAAVNRPFIHFYNFAYFGNVYRKMMIRFGVYVQSRMYTHTRARARTPQRMNKQTNTLTCIKRKH